MAEQEHRSTSDQPASVGVSPFVREIHDLLDDALDDLPRFYAVAPQAEKGWTPLQIDDMPSMVCCVSVEDVREMLRRKCGLVSI
jgi:hypothetical protein